MNKSTEWCPFCEEEVELPIELGIYVCPNCGKLIINCSECTTYHCTKCKLFNEVENARET